MISILITVAKASMLLAVAVGISQLKLGHFQKVRPLYELNVFDEAARAPWGALEFLVWLGARKGTVTTTLGAFVVFSSLTMEPLAQQLITFCTRNVLQEGETPSLSIAISYDHSHTVVGMSTSWTNQLVNLLT